MFDGCARVGVAVSGGADSVALLHALRELYPERPLAVIHLNHSLRGTESDLDEEFVRSVAAGLDHSVFVRHDDVVAEARVAGRNIEEAGRRCRYEFFHQLLSDNVVDVVATAHTRSDQAETVLFRLLRGGGGRGLSAIRPVRDPGIVRPMLDVSRDEVLAYLRTSGLSWREDASNADPAFARNRLRHGLLPVLARDWNANIETILANTADWAVEEEDFWKDRVRRLMDRCVRETAGAMLLDAGLARPLRAAEQRRLIGAILAVPSLRAGGPSFRHIEAVRTLIASPVGSGSVDLPGLRVERSFNTIRFAPRNCDVDCGYEVPLPVPGRAFVPGGSVRVRVLTVPEAQVLYNDGNSAFIDWDRVPRGLRLRNWRAGDRYRPAGQESSRKLKDLFHDARVSAWRRTGWPVVIASDEQIVWAWEFGPAHGLSPTSATRRILALDVVAHSGVDGVSKTIPNAS